MRTWGAGVARFGSFDLFVFLRHERFVVVALGPVQTRHAIRFDYVEIRVQRPDDYGGCDQRVYPPEHHA